MKSGNPDKTQPIINCSKSPKAPKQPTSAEMKAVGRNMAKANAQKRS
jgi:hypothetical protein